MIQLANICFEIGARKLLTDITWAIEPGKRYALVGNNGTGKTTLLRILRGELAAHSGKVIRGRGETIAYLPQETLAAGQGSVFAMVLQARRDLSLLQKQIHDLRNQIETQRTASADLLHKLGDLEHQFETSGGYRWESEAREILFGLGFKPDELDKPLAEMSGGWRMRALLAGLLLQNPDLLLLDEPTNHLDLPALEWLEHFLMGFRGSIILVAHDRFFIDRLAQEIVELEYGAITRYSGNYRRYLLEKTKRIEQQIKRNEEIRAEKERLQRFIDRFRYKPTKAAQVQSRIKQLEKLQEIDIPPPPAHLSFHLAVAQPSHKEVLTVDGLSFRYGSDWLLRAIDFQLFRGQKVALVGVNGAGKTTFTRLICGELTPQEGSLRLGSQTRIGYYAQHQVDSLNLNATVYAEVAASVATNHLPRVRDVLGIFQFHGDDVFKPIGILSGGEKARVSLARILLSPANFLIMDEPTNHLDIGSRAALEEALFHYDGTLLLISHDRYFLDRIVTRVVELRDGQLRVIEGNYSEYLAKREALGDLMPGAKSDPMPSIADSLRGKKNKEQRRLEAQRRQAVSGERRRLESAIKELEKRISELENKKTELESRLADPRTYQLDGEAAETQREYSRITQTLHEHLLHWESESRSLESLLSSLQTTND
ncbi:MAG TPA: ABC-F family ATP-binding cassette domain-containing protein [bacterium]|nr:ABC-F family ATP-binding cassette domain-containing protein [bacterium]